MPRYRTPHKTDGPGIGKKLRGQDLAKRLDELADMAGHHHSEVARHWAGWLNHAKEAGGALLEAKRRLGHRKKWSKWRNRNIINTMSKETSCNYMRIAREWDDARLVHARASGVKLDSIRSVLRVLRGEPIPEMDPCDQRPTEDDTEYFLRMEEYHKSPEGIARVVKDRRDRIRKTLRREFASRLRTLNDAELQVLSENVDEYWFDKLFDGIRNLSFALFGDDDEYNNTPDRKAARKIKQALNKTRMT